ncbi:hypothetical protein HerbRD11066_50570 [Herbidospora sp. RD11066]
MPNFGSEALAFHVSSPRNDAVFAWSAGMARAIRKTAMAAMITRSRMPAPVDANRKGPSPRLRRKADRLWGADPPSRVCVEVAIG